METSAKTAINVNDLFYEIGITFFFSFAKQGNISAFQIIIMNWINNFYHE